jgi:prepilin-type N-terminal cleavage/methylation domain-containing protein/prepilin-type processing-associated H-X9-DG protein
LPAARPLRIRPIPAAFRLPPSAFTLVELLVVTAIVALLLAVLLPAVQAARESSRRMKCQSNLHQLGVASQAYHGVHQAFPPGGIKPRRLQLAWAVCLLPFIDEQPLWRRVDWKASYVSRENQAAASQVVPLYLCPSTSRHQWDRDGERSGDVNGNGRLDAGEGLGMTDYGGMYGTGLVEPLANGVMIWDVPIALRRVTDGASHTLLVGEDSGRGPGTHGEWFNGENIFDVTVAINSQQDNELWSDHPGGVNVLLCDGQVRFLEENTAVELLAALCTRAGREPAGD